MGNRRRWAYALIDMPERSFGRTVRYRRTKLGLSQAKLAELVGRSTSTIRSWERDNTQPTDPKVLSTLAAILAIDERLLFDKADVELPDVEASETVEQALATLTPDRPPRSSQEIAVESVDTPSAPQAPVPAYTAPPDPIVRMPVIPTVAEVSYIEDQNQRQVYRVRYLATLVAAVALVIIFIWALGESIGALGDWWDGFFGNLRL